MVRMVDKKPGDDDDQATGTPAEVTEEAEESEWEDGEVEDPVEDF